MEKKKKVKTPQRGYLKDGTTKRNYQKIFKTKRKNLKLNSVGKKCWSNYIVFKTKKN